MKKRREREREQSHMACSKRKKDEERRKKKRCYTAERTIERRQEARLNHQKAILLTVTSIQRTKRPGDARPPENRGHVTDPPHSDP